MWNYNNFIYILTNKNNTVLYTGVTSNIKQRVYQHKIKHFRISKIKCIFA